MRYVLLALVLAGCTDGDTPSEPQPPLDFCQRSATVDSIRGDTIHVTICVRNPRR